MDPEHARQILASKNYNQTLNTQSTAVLIEQTQHLLDSHSINLLEKEYLLFQMSRSIADRPVSDELRQVVGRLSDYESKLYWSMEHVGRIKEVVAYPIAGTAAAILQDWDLNDQTAALISNGSLQLYELQQYLADPVDTNKSHVFRRLLKQINTTDLLKLTNWAATNAQLLSNHQLVDLLLKSPVESLSKTLIDRLSTATLADASLIRSLKQLVEPLNDSQKYQLLADLVASPGYAATALNLIATTDIDHQQTDALLLDYLSDPLLGGDAAFALSRRLKPSLINELAALLQSENTLLARRAKLSLSLSDNQQARHVLAVAGPQKSTIRSATAATSGGRP